MRMYISTPTLLMVFANVPAQKRFTKSYKSKLHETDSSHPDVVPRRLQQAQPNAPLSKGTSSCSFNSFYPAVMKEMFLNSLQKKFKDWKTSSLQMLNLERCKSA